MAAISPALPVFSANLAKAGILKISVEAGIVKIK